MRDISTYWPPSGRELSCTRAVSAAASCPAHGPLAVSPSHAYDKTRTDRDRAYARYKYLLAPQRPRAVLHTWPLAVSPSHAYDKTRTDRDRAYARYKYLLAPQRPRAVLHTGR
ncbi:unnamed protein product, partial [Iphiclides podalirius]